MDSAPTAMTVNKPNNLTSKRCVPCEGGTPPLETSRVQELMGEIDPQWKLIPPSATAPMKISREFKFKNFLAAMKFVNAVADLAEEEGHHPDFHIHYNIVTIELWTHAVGGLSENDFIVAAKIDAMES